MGKRSLQDYIIQVVLGKDLDEAPRPYRQANLTEKVQLEVH